MVNEGHHLPLEYGGRSGVGSHHRSGVKGVNEVIVLGVEFTM